MSIKLKLTASLGALAIALVAIGAGGITALNLTGQQTRTIVADGVLRPARELLAWLLNFSAVSVAAVPAGVDSASGAVVNV